MTKSTMISNLVEVLLSKSHRKELLSIGDSHSRIFAGIPNVDVHHLGPITAFNLTEVNSTTKGREKLYAVLKNKDPLETAVILSAGEIDIRSHIVRAAVKENISIKNSALRTAKRYWSVVSELRTFGFIVLVLGVHASCSTYENLQYPTFCSIEDRNYALTIFNSYIRAKCELDSVPYSCFSSAATTERLSSRSEFMPDQCHLKTSTIIQGILLYQFIDSIQSLDKLSQNISGLVDISRNKPYELTSSYDGITLGTVKQKSPYFFHTNLGSNQGIKINLLSKYFLSHLQLVNRIDAHQQRAHKLTILLLDGDSEVYRTIIPDDQYFLTNGRPLLVELPSMSECSQVVIYSSSQTILHLSDIQIFAHIPARI